jgi:hypothetical protein
MRGKLCTQRTRAGAERRGIGARLLPHRREYPPCRFFVYEIAGTEDGAGLQLRGVVFVVLQSPPHEPACASAVRVEDASCRATPLVVLASAAARRSFSSVSEST